MGDALCGLDCTKCPSQSNCKGCKNTDGHPFGGSCMLALCRKNKGCERETLRKEVVSLRLCSQPE